MVEELRQVKKMKKRICDFCNGQMNDIPRFKVIRTDFDERCALETTGFHYKDICIKCLKKLKAGRDENRIYIK